MDMNFKVNITADFEEELDVSQILSTYDVDAEMLGVSGSATLDVHDISGSVQVSGRITVEDFEVSAVDLNDFDAESAFAFGFGSLSLSSAYFEVTDSPTGFVAVENAIGRDQAIGAYAALANAGFEVI